jgi:putative transposase
VAEFEARSEPGTGERRPLGLARSWPASVHTGRQELLPGPGVLVHPLRRAERPNHEWALDFQFDEAADQRRLKPLNVVDEHTPGSPGHARGPQLRRHQGVAVIESLVATRGAPEHLRMDNGPEPVAWALRDWCRMAGTATTYIEPGSPWETPFIESFNGRVGDESAQRRGVCLRRTVL